MYLSIIRAKNFYFPNSMKAIAFDFCYKSTKRYLMRWYVLVKYSLFQINFSGFVRSDFLETDYPLPV